MRVLVLGNGNAGYNVARSIALNTTNKVKYVFQFGFLPIHNDVEAMLFDEEKHSEITIASEYNCDIVLSSGWHRKLRSEMLDRQPCFNIHPSLLPKYRGVFPLEFQLLNKERIGGVTIHLMDHGFDSGPIYKQRKFDILESDNLTTLMIKTCRAARVLLNDFFAEYPSLHLTQQDESCATYYSLTDNAQVKNG